MQREERIGRKGREWKIKETEDRTHIEIVTSTLPLTESNFDETLSASSATTVSRHTGFA